MWFQVLPDLFGDAAELPQTSYRPREASRKAFARVGWSVCLTRF